MPTITVSITIAVPDGDPTNGGDFAADLVAHVLTHYSGPIITIDRTGDVLHVQHAPASSLVDEIMAYEADRDAAKRAMRLEAKAHRKMQDIESYQEYLTMSCRTCNAGFDQPCATASGKPLPPYKVHGARRSDFYAHDEVWGSSTEPVTFPPVVLDEV